MLRRSLPVFLSVLHRRYCVSIPEHMSSVGQDAVSEIIQMNRLSLTENLPELRSTLLNLKNIEYQKITDNNVDGMAMSVFINRKEYQMAMSYYQFLCKNGREANLGVCRKFMEAYFFNFWAHGMAKVNEKTILKICDEIMEQYPNLDQETLTNLIRGYSVTSKWMKGFELLDRLKAMNEDYGSEAHSALICGAFLHHRPELAWKLSNELITLNHLPNDVVYLSYVRLIHRKDNFHKISEVLFNYMHENTLRISHNVAEYWRDMAQSFQINAKISPILRSRCKNCNTALRLYNLTEEEFQELKDVVMNSTLIGQNVFSRTTPQELHRFREFLKKSKPFDVVIDALNTLNSKGSKAKNKLKLLRSVVNHFASRDQSILVFGRRHLRKSNASDWNFIQSVATVFLIEDMSLDDPFFLYAALHSGKDCAVVTRDYMREHIDRIPTLRHKLLFTRWLQQTRWHLLTVTLEGKAIFAVPPPYTFVAQKHEHAWHIPLISQDSKDEQWLCIPNYESKMPFEQSRLSY